MNRFLIPVTATALAAGVAIPGFFGRHTIERVMSEPVQTVVREVYHETPVVYTDTVYMPEAQTPVQPVYVDEEYNEYNEYNHTDVYVHEDVVMPPPPAFHHERGRSGDRERKPREDGGYDRPRDRRGGHPGPDQQKVNPRPPVRKTYAPVANDPQTPPVAPIPQYQPVQPKRQAPVRSGVPASSVKRESPKQAPTPPTDKSAAAQSDAAKVQVGKRPAKAVAPTVSAGLQVAASSSQAPTDGH